MYEDIGKRLGRLRREARMSQKELAHALTELGEPVTDKALSKWEQGATLPSARQFLLACRVLKVTDISGEFMGTGPAWGLDPVGRQKLAEYADLLRRSGLYDIREKPARMIRLYTIAASAGPGQFLDDGDYQSVADPNAPAEADFAVTVAGDSMEPRLHDGQRVYVRAADAVEDGDIGLFYWEGSSYIKQLLSGPGGVRLHSLNPAYADIPVMDPVQLRVFGKILQI